MSNPESPSTVLSEAHVPQFENLIQDQLETVRTPKVKCCIDSTELYGTTQKFQQPIQHLNNNFTLDSQTELTCI